jgi:hypothetical protein
MPFQAVSSAAMGAAAMPAAERFADPLTEKLAAFVRGIGIEVRAAALPENTFLPGLEIRDGAILLDETRLAYPGDILHEAGHLAVADPAERNAPTLSPGGAEELTTIAWSYAAVRHLGIDPAIVFHAAFKGGGDSIIENFEAGCYFGVPLMQLYGMSCEKRLAAERGVPPYPHMLRWLR